MEAEILKLLQSMVGSAETLVIWYFVVKFLISVVEGLTVIGAMYWFGRGVRGLALFFLALLDR